MWTALLDGTIPWLVIVAILTMALAAALLIIHLVRTSDGELTVQVRWLGLHVHRRTTGRDG